MSNNLNLGPMPYTNQAGGDGGGFSSNYGPPPLDSYGAPPNLTSSYDGYNNYRNSNNRNDMLATNNNNNNFSSNNYANNSLRTAPPPRDMPSIPLVSYVNAQTYSLKPASPPLPAPSSNYYPSPAVFSGPGPNLTTVQPAWSTPSNATVAPPPPPPPLSSSNSNQCSIGLTLESHPNGFIVAEVDAGGAAEKAGIHAGDLLVGVNGMSAVGRQVVADLISGPPESFVELDIVKPGNPTARRYMVKREDKNAPVKQAAAQKELQDLKDLNKSLQEQLAESLRLSREKDEEIKRLKDNAVQAENMRLRLNELERASSSQEVELVNRIRQLQSERDDLNKSLQDKQTTQAQLESHIASLNNELGALRYKMNDGERLKQHLEVQAHQLSQAHLENSELISQVNRLRSTRSSPISPQQDLRPRLAMIEQELRSVQGRAMQAEANVQKSEQKLQQCMTENRSFLAQLQEVQLERDKLKAENDALHRKKKGCLS